MLQIYLLTNPNDWRWRYVIHTNTLHELRQWEYDGLIRLGSAYREAASWIIRVWLKEAGYTAQEASELMADCRGRPISVEQLLADERDTIRRETSMKLRHLSDGPEQREFALHRSWYAISGRDAGRDADYRDVASRFKVVGYALLTEGCLRSTLRQAGIDSEWIEVLIHSTKKYPETVADLVELPGRWQFSQTEPANETLADVTPLGLLVGGAYQPNQPAA